MHNLFENLSPGKILVIKPSSLGDIVHSLPFLWVFRQAFPETEIHWVVARGLEGILDDHPMIRKLWVIDKDRWKRIWAARRTFAELGDLYSELRREAFDAVVDLQGLLRSGIMSVATGSPVRVGFEEAREGSRYFYTHRVRGGRDVHAVERSLRVASFLGCDTSTLNYPLPPLPSLMTLPFTLPGQYAVIVPSARGEAKKWPVEKFGKLASLLSCPSVVVGSPGDVDLAREVVEGSRGKAVSVAGKTSLKELAAVIGGARFLVSSDTGPMHIAAALGVPVFAVLGPTNPQRTGPYGKIHTVVRSNLPCSPCYRKRKCPQWECMNLVTVEMVFNAIMKSGIELS